MNLLKKQSFTSIIDDVFRDYVSVLKQTYPLLLLIGMLAFLIVHLSAHELWALAVAIVQMFLGICVLLKINAVLTKQPLDWKSIFLTVKKRFIRSLGLGLLSLLILAGVFIATAFIAYAITTILYSVLTFFKPFLQQNAIVHSLIKIWYLPLLPAGIATLFAAFYLWFHQYFFWLDNKPIIQSIKESYFLVKGQLAYLVKNLCLFLIVFVLPYMIITMGSGFFFESKSFAISMLSQFMSALFKVIYYPIFAMVPMVIFYNLKLRVSK